MTFCKRTRRICSSRSSSSPVCRKASTDVRGGRSSRTALSYRSSDVLNEVSVGQSTRAAEVAGCLATQPHRSANQPSVEPRSGGPMAVARPLCASGSAAQPPS